MNRAAVIFTDENHHWLGSLLTPGYRHVFCAVQCGTSEHISVLVDLTLKGVQTHAVAGSPERLTRHYREQGHYALLVPMKTDIFRLPVISHTCVGLTKRLIGHSGRSLTPWQLYRELLPEALPCVSS